MECSKTIGSCSGAYRSWKWKSRNWISTRFDRRSQFRRHLAWSCFGLGWVYSTKFNYKWFTAENYWRYHQEEFTLFFIRFLKLYFLFSQEDYKSWWNFTLNCRRSLFGWVFWNYSFVKKLKMSNSNLPAFCDKLDELASKLRQLDLYWLE